jgi:hypothetical protein
MNEKDREGLTAVVAALFLIGGLAAAVRLRIWIMSPVLNPDGVLYVHQARLFYDGVWGGLTGCGLNFFSIYPVLMAGLYPLVQDWESSARLVSLILGSFTVFPVYIIARCFAGPGAALLTCSLFAVLPVAAGAGGMVARDLTCWFFLAWGMAFFMKQFDGKGCKANLFLSCLFYILASWSRVEAIVFPAVSMVYLALWGGSERWKRIIYFIAPAAGTAALGAISGLGIDLDRAFRLNEVLQKLYGPFSAYALLRGDLKAMAGTLPEGALKEFLSQARHSAWIIGAFSVLNSLLRGLLYLYVLPLAAGMAELRRTYARNGLIAYPILLTAALLLLLFLHAIHTWVMDSRFAMILVMGSLAFIAIGFERILQRLSTLPRLSNKLAFFLLFAAVLSVGLVNVMKFTEKDKLVFKEMGEMISSDPRPGRVVLASSQSVARWLTFYGNLNSADPPCPQQDFDPAEAADYAGLIGGLKARKATHLVFEERKWSASRFDLLSNIRAGDLEELGSWSHPSTGRMILFRFLR